MELLEPGTFYFVEPTSCVRGQVVAVTVACDDGGWGGRLSGEAAAPRGSPSIALRHLACGALGSGSGLLRASS